MNYNGSRPRQLEEYERFLTSDDLRLNQMGGDILGPMNIASALPNAANYYVLRNLSLTVSCNSTPVVMAAGECYLAIITPFGTRRVITQYVPPMAVNDVFNMAISLNLLVMPLRNFELNLDIFTVGGDFNFDYSVLYDTLLINTVE